MFQSNGIVKMIACCLSNSAINRFVPKDSNRSISSSFFRWKCCSNVISGVMTFGVGILWNILFAFSNTVFVKTFSLLTFLSWFLRFCFVSETNQTDNDANFISLIDCENNLSRKMFCLCVVFNAISCNSLSESFSIQHVQNGQLSQFDNLICLQISREHCLWLLDLFLLFSHVNLFNAFWSTSGSNWDCYFNQSISSILYFIFASLQLLAFLVALWMNEMEDMNLLFSLLLSFWMKMHSNWISMFLLSFVLLLCCFSSDKRSCSMIELNSCHCVSFLVVSDWYLFNSELDWKWSTGLSLSFVFFSCQQIIVLLITHLMIFVFLIFVYITLIKHHSFCFDFSIEKRKN